MNRAMLSGLGAMSVGLALAGAGCGDGSDGDGRACEPFVACGGASRYIITS